MAKDNYGADSLTVLEGLDAVRKRPGMYIGTTDSQGLMHCLWEIIDNAVDEALAGACDHITVTLHDDGSVEVADNGRGIPVDTEPKTGLSGVEVVLTKLHAGAKFGNSSYNAVGGLHGVGSSVVNALSARLDIEVDRDGKTHHMAFHQGHPGVYTDADPAHPSPDAPFKRTRKNKATELEIIGKVSPKTTGTRIRYWADPEIFNDTAEFSYEQLIDRVRQTSFLVPGLRITVIDENIPETGDESVDEVREIDEAVSAEGGAGAPPAAPPPGRGGFWGGGGGWGPGATRPCGAPTPAPGGCAAGAPSACRVPRSAAGAPACFGQLAFSPSAFRQRVSSPGTGLKGDARRNRPLFLSSPSMCSFCGGMRGKFWFNRRHICPHWTYHECGIKPTEEGPV